MSRFLGVNYLAGVLIGLSAVLFCTYLGGMRAITWTQVAQCIILLIAYLVPVTILSLRSTGVPLPQIMYGEALQQITQLEAAQGITKSYVTPFNDWTPWNFLALVTCLMLGTAGLPHSGALLHCAGCRRGPPQRRLGDAVYQPAVLHRAGLRSFFALGGAEQHGRQADRRRAGVGRQLVKRRPARIHRSDGARRCADRHAAALGRRHGRARHAGGSRC